MSPATRSEPPRARTEGKTAVIGPNVRVQGELSGDEDIVIEGRVEGKITVTKSLRVGPAAQVNAEIKAQNILIAGRVVGNVTAVERVEILASGTLEGNIRAPKIVIAEGAQFKGSVDMGGKQGPTPAGGPATVADSTSPKNPPAGSPAR
jgi:cytoskeletal protein CcmA (bactofilin family)